MLFPILLTLSLINIIISSVVIAGFVLFASHKLAGPIYRFTQSLEEMSNKNFSPFPEIREGDQFIVFSRTMKKMHDTISNDLNFNMMVLTNLILISVEPGCLNRSASY